MEKTFKEMFIEKWEKYFPGNELPLVCYYSDVLDDAEFVRVSKNNNGITCIFSQLAAVRRGKVRAFNKDNLGCFGAVDMLGFSDSKTDEEIKYSMDFLIKEEKFYSSEEQLNEFFTKYPSIPARGKYIVFKRWDLLNDNDQPLVVSFFCKPDAIGGLHALANYDSMTPHAVISPFSSGCDSLAGFPLRELESDNPKAVLGMFDPSARICLKPDIMTFSIPWPKFISMVENMDRCFLTTDLWKMMCKRMKKSEKG